MTIRPEQRHLEIESYTYFFFSYVYLLSHSSFRFGEGRRKKIKGMDDAGNLSIMKQQIIVKSSASIVYSSFHP